MRVRVESAEGKAESGEFPFGFVSKPYSSPRLLQSCMRRIRKPGFVVDPFILRFQHKMLCLKAQVVEDDPRASRSQAGVFLPINLLDKPTSHPLLLLLLLRISFYLYFIIGCGCLQAQFDS